MILEEEDFFNFFPCIWAWRPFGHVTLTKYKLSLMLTMIFIEIGTVVSEEKCFENVGKRRMSYLR